jgi:GH15 family glucan-1,4-alpha-glucosidase
MAEDVGDQALLGDLHTVALVDDSGALDWLCLPRFDSPACFAALTGAERAGAWLAGPAAGGAATRRRYRQDTLVLESEWDTPEGTVRLVDCMPPRSGAPRVVRILRCVTGRVPVQVLFAPRFDHGLRAPWTRCSGRSVRTVAGADTLWLDGDVPFEPVGPDGAVVARFSLAAGQQAGFVLTHTPSHLDKPAPLSPQDAVAATELFWTGWLAGTDRTIAGDEVVRRALITVKALTHAPTGAVVRTPVFAPGQERRVCDPRDAPAVLTALLHAGLTDEARAWREWLVRAAAGGLSTHHSVDGRAAPADDDRTALAAVLYSLNATDTLWRASRDPAWDLQLDLLDRLESTWDQPGGPVHAKVMAWAAVDRAVRTAEEHGLPGPVDRWRTVRSRIRADVCAKGFDQERNTFTRHYGSHTLDPALLVIPEVGFLPWRDVRVRGTVAAVHAALCAGGPTADPVALDPGTPLASGFLLASALRGTGNPAAATALSDRLVATGNDVGLLGAEYDPAGRGHVPDAASTVGVLNAARRLRR